MWGKINKKSGWNYQQLLGLELAETQIGKEIEWEWMNLWVREDTNKRRIDENYWWIKMGNV